MRKILKIIRSILVVLVAAVIPRSKKIWVIGGNRGLRFADNSMYFYLYCLAQDDIKVVWLTKKRKIVREVRARGGVSYLSNSLKGLYYGFRASWHIYDVNIADTNKLSSLGSRKLNLWHGYPLKDIRFLKKLNEAKIGACGLVVEWIKIHILRIKPDQDNTYFLWQNNQYADHILDSFDIKRENLVIANMPRNIVFDVAEKEKYWHSEYSRGVAEKMRINQAKGYMIVGYFPTWRLDSNDLFMGAKDHKDFERLNDFCEKNKIIILTKWHTCSYKEYEHKGLSQVVDTISEPLQEMSSVVLLEFETDLNSVLPICDMLITDYSSVMYDYLHTGRPMIFCAYDLEEYSKTWGFFQPYTEHVPGPIVYNIDSLCSEISKYINKENLYSDIYKEKRDYLLSSTYDRLEGSSYIHNYIKLN